MKVEVSEMTDQEYAAWRSRQIRIASRLGQIGFCLSLISIALSLKAAGYLF